MVKSHPLEFSSWSAMKKRCYNPKCNGYDNYGGRGITVCKRWLIPKLGFWNFLQDMGPRTSKNHSLDRIKTNRNYTPKNCKWSSKEEQGRNKRTNVVFFHNGENVCLVELALRYGLDPRVLQGRLRSGKISLKDALAIPAGYRRGIKVKLVSSGVVYESIRSAAEDNGLTYACLKQRLKGKEGVVVGDFFVLGKEWDY